MASNRSARSCIEPCRPASSHARRASACSVGAAVQMPRCAKPSSAPASRMRRRRSTGFIETRSPRSIDSGGDVLQPQHRDPNASGRSSTGPSPPTAAAAAAYPVRTAPATWRASRSDTSPREEEVRTPCPKTPRDGFDRHRGRPGRPPLTARAPIGSSPPRVESPTPVLEDPGDDLLLGQRHPVSAPLITAWTCWRPCSSTPLLNSQWAD